MKCCHFFVQTAIYNMIGYPNTVNKPTIGYESASSKGSENYNEGWGEVHLFKKPMIEYRILLHELKNSLWSYRQ